MTNDNPKSDCCNQEMKYDGGVGYCTDCLHPCDPKPLPSEPSCEHDKGDHWRGITSLATKKEYPNYCPYCKPVEPSSKHESWCNWHIDNRLCSCKPVVCNVVEPSVEALEWIQKILPSTNEQIDHLLKERPFEFYHILCVDIPDVIEKALTTHKSRNERNRK